MAKYAKFVPNRAGIRSELLQNETLGAKMQAAAEDVAPANTEVTTVKGKARMRTWIKDPTPAARRREAKSGHLSRALNALRF